MAVTRSTGTVVRFHLGTVAFGAMVIGLVRLIRAIFAFIQNRLKGLDNDCARGILWCCHCCLWCFECALKFLTRNAYIETGEYFLSTPIDFVPSINRIFIQFRTYSYFSRTKTSKRELIRLITLFSSYLWVQLLFGWKKSLPSTFQ